MKTTNSLIKDCNTLITINILHGFQQELKYDFNELTNVVAKVFLTQNIMLWIFKSTNTFSNFYSIEYWQFFTFIAKYSETIKVRQNLPLHEKYFYHDIIWFKKSL